MSIPRTAPLLCVLALAAALAGCGSDDEKGKGIPANLAGRLEARLDVVDSQLKAGGGACDDIQNKTFPVIRQDLSSLPSDTDAGVRDALEQSFARLQDLAAEQCDDEKGQDTTPTETDTTPPPTDTTPTETDTTPTDTSEQQTNPDENFGQQKKEKKQKKTPPGQGGGAPIPEGDE